MILHFYTDGACSGNPGPGGASAVAVREDGTAQQMARNRPRQIHGFGRG